MDEPSNTPSSPGRRRIIEFSSSPPRDRSEVGQSDNLPTFEDETNILGRDVDEEDEVRVWKIFWATAHLANVLRFFQIWPRLILVNCPKILQFLNSWYDFFLNFQSFS